MASNNLKSCLIFFWWFLEVVILVDFGPKDAGRMHSSFKQGLTKWSTISKASHTAYN